MNLKSAENQEEKFVLNEDDNKKRSETTAIRISSELYELLREKAFYDRSTIRQVADDILKVALKR